MADVSKRRAVLVENIKLPLTAETAGYDEAALAEAVRRYKKAALPGDIADVRLHRRSVDARDKNAVNLVYSVAVAYENAGKRRLDGEALLRLGMKPFDEPETVFARGGEKMSAPPVIAGFGPAGIFAALTLAENGYAPLVLERGGDIPSRIRAVERFYSGGGLDENCNIQFGAGGAGTFSDGKLTTRTNDPKCPYILRRFAEFGAPRDILYMAKPHIGTDRLRAVITAAAERIISLGGTIRYGAAVKGISDSFVTLADGEKLPFGVLVVATGHSARDIYGHMLDGGWDVRAKPYSVGVRVEHKTAFIDEAMYGGFAGHPALGHAEYQLSSTRGRGVYTFCMCPGGEVVAASSERGSVVVNGMSRRARDGENSNAAVAVSVNPSDYGSDPRAAISFRADLERAAFASVSAHGEYFAPMQTVGDFYNGTVGKTPPSAEPSYMNGRVAPADLRSVLPAFVTEALESGLRVFGSKLRGFDGAGVPMTGVETRTSSPVRIWRGDDLTAPGYPRVYPCGEGAGYAGGIMSAAADGITVASAIMGRYSPA